MADMGAFWDERARDDPFHFVDNRIAYRDPDLDRFWAGGAADLDTLLGLLDLAVEEHQTVVDVGCGVGRLTRALAARAARVLAVDVSREMLDRARELNPHLGNVEWMHGSGRDLQPIADATADAVVSHVVFQHIPDPAVTLGYVREMGRVLRPGGWAGFQVSTDPSIHTRRRRLRRRPEDHPAWLGAPVDLDDLRRTAGDARLELERVVNPGQQHCLVRARRL